MSIRSRSQRQIQRWLLAICWIGLLGPGAQAVLGQEKPPAADSTAAKASAKLPPEQLDALVAPIALYPDELLTQTLVASTYPLEIVQLQQWLAKHPKLKDKALADSVSKQPWDPSIQSMAAVPEVVKRLADDIQWSTDLGNAFLAQQGDVMDAVQRMRKKAKDKGALESNEQQKVETKVVEEKTVIVVQQTNPEVIYVPSYSPTVVYGPPVYPYPPIYYPYYPPGAAFVTFTAGVMMGAAIWGGACCHAGWGGNTVVINNNNHFNQINHNGNRGGNGNWQHNAEHRGGAPYGDRATANKYGGQTRGQGSGGAGVSNRAAGGAGGGAPSASNRAAGGAGGGAPSAGNRAAGGAGGAGAGGGARPSTQPASKSGASKPSGFSGGSGGYNGGGARASSSRGASSMGSRGMSRGGGGGRRR
jgi:hypothetical protein